jgi:hypothetical protein
MQRHVERDYFQVIGRAIRLRNIGAVRQTSFWYCQAQHGIAR